VPCFITAPRFARRRNTVSALFATISLNAASPEEMPFACGPQSVLRKPGQLIASEIPGPAIGSLWRNGIGIYARRKQLDRGVQICEVRPLTRNPFFEVVNVAADFSALEAKGRNYVGIGHAPNLGADPIHFLWQLRHNTAIS
jgi:hypothetical protein